MKYNSSRVAIIALALVVVLTGCTPNNSNNQESLFDLEKLSFGEHLGEQVDLFVLTNNNGMEVKLTNYGATVTDIIVPDKNGKRGSIAAGFDSFESYFSEEYIKNSPYFGGTIGRYASVIKNAEFTLDGTDYSLDKNMGEHHLHGGTIGFDRQVWQAQPVSTESYVGVRFSLLSPDGDQGYPGNVKVDVEYQLNNKNELSISYSATTDKATPLSLTNHTYFNLNGFERDILDHQLQLNSDYILTPDEANIADGSKEPVLSTVYDFNKPKKLGDAFTELPMGFEHFYLFDNPQKDLIKVVTVSEASSGRTLEVLTTEPSTLLYTGRYTSDNLAREDGTQFGQFKAFCIETSKYQNGPNIIGIPQVILQANEIYKEKTVYRLIW